MAGVAIIAIMAVVGACLGLGVGYIMFVVQMLPGRTLTILQWIGLPHLGAPVWALGGAIILAGLSAAAELRRRQRSSDR